MDLSGVGSTETSSSELSSDQTNFASSLAGAESVSTEDTSSDESYDPIPWKGASPWGAENGAYGGGEAGPGSVTPTAGTFIPPSGNVNLDTWKLTEPIDLDGDGKADEFEGDLSSYSSENFIHNADGSVTFTTSAEDLATTIGSKYPRSELREMLNRDAGTQDMANNWVLSTSPSADQQAAGGVGGNMSGTVSIDQVTTSGDPQRVGRAVFAQIHAEDSEPLRLYYRKLPDNELGSIYFGVEDQNGEYEDFYTLIGSPADDAPNPEDGIALGEAFNFDVTVEGNFMTVSVTTQDGNQYSKTVDISQYGYTDPGTWMYFKQGAYDQNNTSTDPKNDYIAVTTYDLEVGHDTGGGMGTAASSTPEAALPPSSQPGYQEAYDSVYTTYLDENIAAGMSEKEAEDDAENRAEDFAEDNLQDFAGESPGGGDTGDPFVPPLDGGDTGDPFVPPSEGGDTGDPFVPPLDGGDTGDPFVPPSEGGDTGGNGPTISPHSSTGGGDISAANQAALEARFQNLYIMLMEKQVSFKEAVEPYKTDNQNAGKG